MANTKSAAKNARKAERRAVLNRTVRSRLQTLKKKVTALRTASKPEEARAAAIEYVSALDKAVQSNVIHRNAASRHKSQVSTLVLAKKS
jgi:small subunit ribosomal protein S20